MINKRKIKDEIRYYENEIKGNPDFPRYRNSLNRYIKMLNSKKASRGKNRENENNKA